MFVVCSGCVVLSKRLGEEQVTIAKLGPGEFFGEMALVDDGPRTATAVADAEQTRVVALDKSKFLYLVSQQPPFALTIMRGLCERMRQRWSDYRVLFEKVGKDSAHI